MNLFGAGYLVGRPAATATNANPTPRKFGLLQEVSFDVTYTPKTLMGPKQFALREFRAEGKAEIKAKFARINGRQLAEIFYGLAPGQETTGSTIPVFGETATIPASTPYTLTAANAGVAGANFVEDFGPEYAATGKPFQLVAASPTQGQYSVSAGTYTFAAADAGVAIVLNYSYSNALAGFTFSVPNLEQGESPYFEAILTNPTDGGFVRRVYRCSASKLTKNFKMGDIVIPELDIKVYDPGTGVMWQDSYASE